MKKKIVTLLLLVSLSCVGFAGCGNDGTGASASVDNANTEGSIQEENPNLLAVTELSFIDNNTRYITASNDIVFTMKNGLIGACDYSGNEIVGHNYQRYYCEPNSEGYFALGNDDSADIYNKSGELVYQISSPNTISINEGVISYTYVESTGNKPVYGFKAYNIATGKNVAFDESYSELAPEYTIQEKWGNAVSIFSCSACNNGQIYVMTYIGNIYRYDFATDKYEQITSATMDNAEGYLDQAFALCFRLNPTTEWLPVFGGGYSDKELFEEYVEDGKTEEITTPKVVGLLSTNKLDCSLYELNKSTSDSEDEEGNLGDWVERKLVDMTALAEKMGVEYTDTWSIQSYSDNGVNKGAKEQLLVVEFTYRGTTKYCLLDFSKAEVNKMRMVTNLNDIVVFTGDYLSLSADNYFLAAEGNDYFYIDASGQKVADYEKCSEFINGYATIIEDGMAYIVDTNFTKVSNGYAADTVSTVGDFFGINKGGKTTYIKVTK